MAASMPASSHLRLDSGARVPPVATEGRVVTPLSNAVVSLFGGRIGPTTCFPPEIN